MMGQFLFYTWIASAAATVVLEIYTAATNRDYPFWRNSTLGTGTGRASFLDFLFGNVVEYYDERLIKIAIIIRFYAILYWPIFIFFGKPISDFYRDLVIL